MPVAIRTDLASGAVRKCASTAALSCSRLAAATAASYAVTFWMALALRHCLREDLHRGQVGCDPPLRCELVHGVGCRDQHICSLAARHALAQFRYRREFDVYLGTGIFFERCGDARNAAFDCTDTEYFEYSHWRFTFAVSGRSARETRCIPLLRFKCSLVPNPRPAYAGRGGIFSQSIPVATIAARAAGVARNAVNSAAAAALALALVTAAS